MVKRKPPLVLSHLVRDHWEVVRSVAYTQRHVHACAHNITWMHTYNRTFTCMCKTCTYVHTLTSIQNNLYTYTCLCTYQLGYIHTCTKITQSVTGTKLCACRYTLTYSHAPTTNAATSVCTVLQEVFKGILKLSVIKMFCKLNFEDLLDYHYSYAIVKFLRLG